MPATFIKQAVLSRKTTGAVVPSSSKLSKAIVKYSNIPKSKVVVELGAGTGVITKQIVKKLNSDTTFFAVELNEQFAEITRECCPGATIHNGCATEIAKFLGLHGHTHCDTIISGLPWASFPHALQRNILKSVTSSLAPGGEFITFAYLGANYLPAGKRIRRLLEKNFSRVDKTKVIWQNVPPAFIYHCVK